MMETSGRRFTSHWDKINQKERNEFASDLEKAIVKQAGIRLKQNPDTVYLTKEQRRSMETRAGAGRPFVIIDVPRDKPGSRVSMEYVMEEDRRELRKADRICGASARDAVWHEYAQNLREKAGRIRVYVHPKYVEAVRSAVDKHWMSQVLEYPTTIKEKISKMGSS